MPPLNRPRPRHSRRRLICICLCLLPLAIGCDSDDDDKKSSSAPAPTDKSASTPTKTLTIKKKSPSPAPSPIDQTLHEGKTFAQWVDLLGDRADGPVASEVLMRAGESAIPALLAALQSESKDRRIRVMDILRGRGGENATYDPRVIEAFIAALDDKESAIRKTAIGGLRDARVKQPRVIAKLAALLQVNRAPWDEQTRVLGYLTSLGPDAAAATEAVAKMLATHDRKYARRKALTTLLAIGGDRAEVSKGLVAAMWDEDDGICDLAEDQVLRLKPGPRAKQVDELLVDLLDSNDGLVRETTRELLIDLGARVVPRMIEALHDPRLSVRKRAVFVLGKIGPPAKAALKPLRQKLNDNDKETRGLAKLAIDKIEGKL